MASSGNRRADVRAATPNQAPRRAHYHHSLATAVIRHARCPSRAARAEERGARPQAASGGEITKTANPSTVPSQRLDYFQSREQQLRCNPT
jgi:hypothetical protein